MSPETSPESSSPQASGRKVQNGRIEKSKAKKDSKQPTYRIGGRTFACEACKKGHRVSKCTHASERPVSMTNDPGRPSGDQKRHCDCPKQCACTKKNCKCDRNCSCTQSMYMLVYVPMKDGEKAKEGEWQIGQEVITDLQGKQLTDEEIRVRNELKQLQQMARSGTPGSATLKASPTISESTPRSCCQHKKNIEEQKQPEPTPEELPAGQRRPQCNCGTGCTCAFCLDHPNNQTSHLLAQQQAAYFSSQTHGQQQMYPSWEPPQVGGSCMGTNPRFAVSNTPNPSQSQFQSLFPAVGPAGQGGYFISYPFTKFSGFVQPAFVQPLQSPMMALPMGDPPLMPYKIESMSPAPLMQSSTSSCCHPPKEIDTSTTQEISPIDAFDFSSYDIGDAVASGWNGLDDFAFDPVFESPLPSFSAERCWDSAIDPLPDLGTSIIDTANIKPAYASPGQVKATSTFSPPSSLPHASASAPPHQFLHQSCCQPGNVQQTSQVLHDGLLAEPGVPVHYSPLPMMHSIYTHSPS
jgi:hypothetical protein